MKGFIYCDLFNYEHGEDIFELNKDGYENWLEKIKTEIINGRDIFHKWNVGNK